MDGLFSLKIDLSKIDESKIFQGKNGAQYLDIILIPTPDNAYGNSHMACQSVTKEEKAVGKRGAILGNAKPIGGGAPQQQSSPAARRTPYRSNPVRPPQPTERQQANLTDDDADDLPF